MHPHHKRLADVSFFDAAVEIPENRAEDEYRKSESPPPSNLDFAKSSTII